MNSYYIDIIDQVLNQSHFIVEDTSKGGVILAWNGGDKKDELRIVGSSLEFDLAHNDLVDAKWINFFTGNEVRFKVELRKYSDDSLIWTGFLIPDTYSEPYTNNVTFVKITAICGLARLKGKYLPDDYYDLEKSLIDIFCTILELTGFQMDLYFAPAIENFTDKDWNQIFIDTSTFFENKKKYDAYRILETLLSDTLCICYQSDCRWYIEGVNKRHLREVNYSVYGFDRVYKNNFAYKRVLKRITPLVTPAVTIIPPYNNITVTHTKVEPSFPKDIAQEINDGWVIVNNIQNQIHSAYWMGNNQIYPSSWMGNGGLYAKCFSPKYYCNIQNKSQFGGGSNINFPQDDTQWISLKKKIFFKKSQKVKISFSFAIKRPGISIATPEDMNYWKNPFKYEFIYNNIIVFSNFGGEVTEKENVIFNQSAKADLEIEHIFKEDGLFDVRIYGPPGTTNINRVEGILIEDASIDVVGFEEQESYTDLINDEFTIDKDVELIYSDDSSGNSKGFRLEKLKVNADFFNEIEVPIQYGFSLNGKNYSVVELDGANLIAENIFSVYKDSLLIAINDVVYNYNDGEQMVIETNDLISSGSFYVKIYAVKDIVDRVKWMRWTDSVYKIENFPYAKIVANIYRRMFSQAHEKLDLTAYNAVKFNDIILFNYVYDKDFMVLNCSWDIDQNKTTLTLARSGYGNANNGNPDANMLPIVLAGDDIYIDENATTALLSATANDPDGYIASQVWTKITGGFGDVIMNPLLLSTSLQNLTEDFYTYQIKVTDNDGAEATDTVNIIRVNSYVVDLLLVEESVIGGWTRPEIMKKFKLTVTPNIMTNFSLTFNGVSLVSYGYGNYGADGYGRVEIKKNGSQIFYRNTGDSPGLDFSDNLVFNYIATDEIYIWLYCGATAGEPGSGDTGFGSASITLNKATFTQGQGIISGIPIDEVISASA